MPIVVSNASPLIGLSSINHLQGLKKLWNEIIIPDAVYKEVIVNGKGKAGVDAISDACQDWIKISSVKNRQEVDALRAVLDDGEAEVIALGQELKADFILLDNREPRLFAKTVNLKVIGTVGIIKLFFQKGFIDNPIKELYRLRQRGFWLSNEIIDQMKSEIYPESS